MKTAARTLTTKVRETRERRRSELRTRRELAHYYTPADRLEIDAIIARHTPDSTRDIEMLLVRQRVR